LRGLKSAVAELRMGKAFGVLRGLPSEVRPLVIEISALVRQNRATVDRARNHVGNLAHALRTRLAITRNALDQADISVARQEITEAENLVQHYLARARAAALTHSAAMTVPLLEVGDALAVALRRLFADRGLTILTEGDRGVSVQCDRDDLMEMLGNLMENACKWARQTIRVTVSAMDGMARVTVSDDGPGLPAALIDAVLRRGNRLDEAQPGTGLGLSITAELVRLYGGQIELISPGPDGGLAVSLSLPRGNGWPRHAGARAPV
jgi:signal transduction histidine kinase